jgi:OmpA-OmpF porin, OOP family
MKTSRIICSALAAASLTLTLVGVASADSISKEGYLIDSRGNLVRSGNGLCWRTGYWSPAMAIVECDPELVKKETPKEEVKPPPPPPPPPPAPPPPPEVVPEAPAFLPISLQAETLFDFDKSVIHDAGKKKLNIEVVAKMNENPQVEEILVTGHTDRIGIDAYNRKLSQRRADAVKSYLIGQGIDGKRIKTAAKGGENPIASCSSVKGKASSKNKKLVECLRPNRRVVVEISIQKPVQK